MISGRHPSRRRLQQWLDGAAPRRVDRHVDDCEHCQAELEELSALDEALVADLHEVVTPPEDIRARTHDGVGERLRDEAALGAFFDLFTVAWDTARTIVDPEIEAPGVPAEVGPGNGSGSGPEQEGDESSSGEAHLSVLPADGDGGGQS